MQDQISTVFVVDDDEAVRDSLTALLESDGLSVRTFEAATPFLEFYDPQVAGCLALDIHLPDMNGLDALRRLREIPADRLMVIMITGEGDIGTAVAAMKIGAADFIEKPFDHEEFLKRVHALLAESEARRQRGESLDGINARVGDLTPRERDVLNQLVDGHPNKVIAYNLGISARTVELHRARVMQKMEARTVSHLMRMAAEAGLLED